MPNNRSLTVKLRAALSSDFLQFIDSDVGFLLPSDQSDLDYKMYIFAHENQNLRQFSPHSFKTKL